MGGGCLKILGCVRDPEENADVEAVEGKSLRSKPKWSIRKRSASGQVLSSNVMKEPACVPENRKDSSDTGSSYCCPATDIPMAKPNREVSDSLPVCKSADNLDPINGPVNSYSTIEESVAIAIQTGIRVYLAQKELAKVKNVIKLQAVVRGHLVRRQAIGTLRCVQAIVKMQALVRARHTKRTAEKLVLAGKAEGGNLDSKQDNMYYTSEKLLANAFVRLLMESAPSRKTKTIHISCDPSKSDSAWRWLERWMTVTASPQLCLSECAPEEAAIADTAKLLTEVEVALVPPVKKQEDANELESIQGADKSEIPCDVTSKEHDPSELQNPGCAQKEGLSPLMKHDQNESTIIPSKESGASLSNQIPLESDANQVSAPLGERHVVDLEKSRRTTKRMSESREVEGKKSRFASEKSLSPAFAAVQPKFEELSANSTSNKLVDLHHESMDDKNPSSNTPQSCSSMKSEVLSSENASSNETRNQTVFSECGTEISISSTLESPDRPKTEVEQAVRETEIRDHIGNTNVHDACLSETTSQPTNNAVGNNCDTLQETMLSETGKVFDKSLSADDIIVDIDQQLPRQAPHALLLEEPDAPNMPLKEPAVTDIPLEEPAVTNIPLQEPSATDIPLQEPMASDKPVEEPVIPNMPVHEPVASEEQLQEPVALNLLVQEPTELDIPLHDLASSDSPHQEPTAADMLHQEPVTPEMSYQETTTLDMPSEEAATSAMPPQEPEAPVAVPQEPEAPIVVLQEPITPTMPQQESPAPTLPPEDPVACDTFSSEPTAPCIILEETAPSIVLSEKPSESGMSGQLEEATVQQTCKSSPQGSPISHLTASEPQGTPSSEVSSTSKKSKTNNNLHSRKQRLQWSEKKPPSNTKAESGAKVAVENPQNPKSEKRQKSLGTTKPDHSDHEPQVSSSKYIPNYMQATESAKAKGHASHSPKARPDVHEKVGNTKKRHSLPSTNNENKIYSPCMQRSPSQAQQPSKANGTPSPQNSAERKWQR